MRISWNSILAYETVKTCSVRDWRLGALHYLFEAVIFAYIIWQIVTKTLYIDKSPVAPAGVSFSLLLNQTAVSGTTPAYCSSAADGCLFWTEKQTLFPVGTPSSLFLTTRVTVSNYAPPPAACLSTNNSLYLVTTPDFSCSPFSKQVSSKVHYIANLESMTLLLSHTARSAIDSPVVLSSADMVGKMYNPSKSEVRSFDEAYHSKNAAIGAAGDIISVGELLSILGINLDTPIDADDKPAGAKAGETLRSSGMIISWLISYQNRESGIKDLNNVALKYKYYPTKVPRAEYKISESTINQADGSATVVDRHGIFVSFSQSGQIGDFSFMALLNSLVASIALLKVASLIVDFLMLQVMPQKKVYREVKYDVSGEIGKPIGRKAHEEQSVGAIEAVSELAAQAQARAYNSYNYSH